MTQGLLRAMGWNIARFHFQICLVYMKSKKERNLGQFYTPTLFVDHAHKMISEQFGEDWKERFVVWDNCCGTKNLTRDYSFNELYCSTLEEAELHISERYNREATSFQFDFLNDSLDKLPQGLKDALENNKPIIFLINPPYAISSCIGEKTKGKGATATMVYEEMTNEGMGNANKNLYIQFIYRIIKIKKQYNLTDVHIGMFSPTAFLSGGACKAFRGVFFKEFAFNNAVQFKASHFADVADNWGISFSIWNSGETINKNNFGYTLIDNVDGEIKEIGNKIVYNTDNETLGKVWARELVKDKKTFDRPTMSNALTIKIGDNSKTKIAEDAIGCYMNAGNNVDQYERVALFTSCDSTNAMGMSICKENFSRVVSMFSARKLIEKNWVNSADEFLAPNTESEKWNEFENDSMIYSIFNGAANQSSLRQVEYKGKNWDIKNEFFFMSKDEVMELANENNLDFTYNDARVSNERYVYTKLQQIDLSKEAQAVLDKATELTINSFKYRELFNDEHPEYQILNWDCGWYQIKGMLKEFMPQEYKEFAELFKALAEKMRPMVYELGFLK